GDQGVLAAANVEIESGEDKLVAVGHAPLLQTGQYGRGFDARQVFGPGGQGSRVETQQGLQRRLVQQSLCRPLHEEFTAVHDAQVAVPGKYVIRCIEQEQQLAARFARQMCEEVCQLGARLDVQTVEGFVEYQQFGPGQQGLREQGLARLSAAE